jgi:hypothetical protein
LASALDDFLAQYGPRIRALYPDPMLHTATLNGEGLVNDVVVVNFPLLMTHQISWARKLVDDFLATGANSTMNRD